jgi:CDP-paratose 2-epimerase
MGIAVITGSGGLVGSEAARLFAGQGLTVLGIDNDMRAKFFGQEGSTRRSWSDLHRTLPGYTHIECDIRDADAIAKVFAQHGSDIEVVIHAAAQPSHEWASLDPAADFTINANGTLHLLEATRRHCPDVVFIFCSTNKVYGDTANHLPFEELESRWELVPSHPAFAHGIDETMNIDGSMHSLYGVSKCAADLLVQEYGRSFGIRSACFRCGCVTGPGHAGTKLHGFLSYLVKCAVQQVHYTVFGYKGKQVRDNLHAVDLANAFWQYFQNPRAAEVYNMGGGREANCSILEAIAAVEQLTGRPMSWSYNADHRPGDLKWWISDTRRFQSHYPSWRMTYDIGGMIEEIFHAAGGRR